MIPECSVEGQASRSDARYLFHLDGQIHRSTLNKIRRRLRLALDVLSEKKELVIGPAITLVPQLFSLPLFISAFILDCQNLDNSWLRYFLIVSYWLSFTPQWTSFFLHIFPSSFYSNEWRRTTLGRRIHQTFRRYRSPTSTVLTGIRDILQDKY